MRVKASFAAGLAVVGLGLAGAALVSAGPAYADNGPHVSTTGNMTVDRCAGCHRAHSAKASSLLQTDSTQLCVTCHSLGTGALTDVMAGTYYPDFINTSDMTGLRGGGFTKSMLDTANATGGASKTVPAKATGVAVTSTHSINGTSQTAWGMGAINSGAGNGIMLKCGSCHDPHGNGNYRILRPIPTGSPSTTDVVIADAAVKKYFTTNYWNAADAESTSFIANISAWCSSCHTRYLSDDGNVASGDSIYSFRHKSNDNTAGGPNCIQCHVAHGSNASMAGSNSAAVKQPDGTAAPAGDSRLLRLDNRGTCEMCHAY